MDKGKVFSLFYFFVQIFSFSASSALSIFLFNICTYYFYILQIAIFYICSIIKFIDCFIDISYIFNKNFLLLFLTLLLFKISIATFAVFARCKL